MSYCCLFQSMLLVYDDRNDRRAWIQKQWWLTSPKVDKLKWSRTPRSLPQTQVRCNWTFYPKPHSPVDCVYSPIDRTFCNDRLTTEKWLRVIMGQVARPLDRRRLLGYRLTCDFRFSLLAQNLFPSYRKSLFVPWPEVLHEIPTPSILHNEPY